MDKKKASNGKDNQIEWPALKSQTLDSNPNSTQPRIKFDQTTVQIPMALIGRAYIK